MYKKSAEGWLKHGDFILLDIICLQLSFVIAYYLRQGDGNLYTDHLYSGVAISFILCQIAVMFFSQSYQGILKRGYYAEFTKTVKHVCMVMLLSMAYLFVSQQSEQFSRIIFFITAGIYLVITYIVRLLWKRYVLMKNLTDKHKKSMVLVVASDEAEITIKRMMSGAVQDFVITGIAFMDKGFKGDTFNEIPVIGDIDTVHDYLCREWVDEVFVKITDKQPYPRKLIDEKNPRCELAIDGGLRHDNMDPLIACNPDVIILSSAIFKDPDGIKAGVQKCRKAIDEAAAKYGLE